VMPVKVDEDTVMKGISPGDRVDVMVFLRRNGQEISVTGVFTILKNVRVFAVNTSTERGGDGKGESSNFRTISLLVKPDHARELGVAAQMGKILLTLRRPDERDQEGVEEVTPLEEILTGKSKTASDAPGSGAGPSGPGILQVIKDAGGTPPQGNPGANLPPAEPKFKMLIRGPSEVKQYEWTDEKGLPVDSTIC